MFAPAALQELGDYLILTYNSGLQAVVAPVLRVIRGGMHIDGNAALTLIQLPLLTYVAQYVRVNNNVVLARIFTPALTTIACLTDCTVAVNDGTYAASVCDNNSTFTFSSALSAAAASPSNAAGNHTCQCC